MSDKTFVNHVKISNTKAVILFALTDVLPGAKSNRISGVVVVNTGPPEPSYDRINVFNKGFGEKDSGHIIDWDRSKNRLDVSESACMIKLVSSNNSELGTNFTDDEIVSFVLVSMTKNHWMTQMHSIVNKVRHREDVNLMFGLIIDFLTEEDGRLVKIGHLARKLRELLKNNVGWS